MEEDNRPSDAVPVDSDVRSTEGDEKVSANPDNEGADALSLEELNATLGRQFKTKEGALKAIKDTYAFVGKSKEEKKSEQTAVTSNDEIESLKTELFFTQNPDFKDARPILEALAKANGQSIQAAAESDAGKDVLSKFAEFGKHQEKETVMEGNRRFSVGEDQQKEFTDAVGNREKMAQYVLKHYLPNAGK